MTMSRETGLPISELSHIAQSIADILTTSIGSRLMRREYGSIVPDLIDQPTNEQTKIRIFAGVAAALMRWEPRIKLYRIGFELGTAPGQSFVDIYGVRRATGEALDMRIPLTFGGAT